MQYSLIHEELEIPKNISVTLSNKRMVIKGPKAEVEKDFSFAKGILITLLDNKIVFESTFGTKQQKSTLYRKYFCRSY